MRDFTAPCAADPDAMFPVSHGREGNDRYERQAAQKWCTPCPLKDACLKYALDIESNLTDSFGVYGGKTGNERRAIINARKAIA